MKLIRVKIYGFGKWVDQEFLLDRDYQIIVGDNEAGKTTFLTFIKSVLFGFASGRGSQKFEQYRPKQASSYGGELEFVDSDEVHWVIRRVDGKGDGNVSLFRDGQVVPDTLISQITGDLTKNDYEETHVFNDETIRSLYDLNEEKLETEIMSLGAAGSKQWLATADDLEKSSSAIYKSRGLKQPLVTSIKKYQELQQEKASFKNQQQEYIKLSQELTDTTDQLNTLQQRDSELTIQQKDRQRLVDKIPRYVRMKSLEEENIHLDNQITSDDWDKFIQLEQQVKTLKTSNQQQAENRISSEEKALIDNYYSNQADIDFIFQRQNDVQNNLFEIDHLNESLRKSDFQTDNLRRDNPDLTDEMTELDSSDINQLQTPVPKNRTPIFIGILLVLLIAFFMMSGVIAKAIPVLGLVVLGLLFYDRKQVGDQVNSINQKNRLILKQHASQKLSVDRALKIQPQIQELAKLRSEQRQLDQMISTKSAELEKWIQLAKKVKIVGENITSRDLIAEMNRYYTQLNQIKTKQEIIQQDDLRRSQVLRSSKQGLQELNVQLEKIFAKYFVTNSEELSALHEQQQSSVDELNQLKADREFIGDDRAELSRIADFNKYRIDLDSLNQQIQGNSDQINELLTRKGYIESQLKQVFFDDTYQKVENDLMQTKTDIIEQYDQWLADKLASEWIKKMLDQASENRYPKMLKNANRYFSTLTNSNYIDINMDKTNSLILIRQDKVKFDVHEISKATRIQLYLALRLAFVIEINSIVNLPILIDDAFVDFDETRLNNIYQLLDDISEDNQILFVTTKTDGSMPMQHVLSLEGK